MAMKSLLFVLLLICSSPSLASSYNQFKALCEFAPICETFTTSQTNIDAIFFDLLTQEDIDEEDFDLYYQPRLSSLPSVDDIVWGNISLSQAQAFIYGHTNEDYYGATLSESAAHSMATFLNNNSSSNISFGFSAYGGGATCGISWPALLIIFPSEGKVLQIGLFGWQSC
jgi:hypothetical protein